MAGVLAAHHRRRDHLGAAGRPEGPDVHGPAHPGPRRHVVLVHARLLGQGLGRLRGTWPGGPQARGVRRLRAGHGACVALPRSLPACRAPQLVRRERDGDDVLEDDLRAYHHERAGGPAADPRERRAPRRRRHLGHGTGRAGADLLRRPQAKVPGRHPGRPGQVPGRRALWRAVLLGRCGLLGSAWVGGLRPHGPTGADQRHPRRARRGGGGGDECRARRRRGGLRGAQGRGTCGVGALRDAVFGGRTAVEGEDRAA
mmetsp:Transcript_77215/g.221156  ORF Transcript_77215/g.221156 Transcript_77215/m.221156 type:complete len:257 (-) Transcript_77215:1406-2176(-)